MASTAVSWALTLSLVGVGVYYYRPDLVRSLAPVTQPVSEPNQEASTRPLNKRTKSKKTQPSDGTDLGPETASSTSNDAQSSKKRKIITPAVDNTRRTDVQKDVADQDSTEVGDKEFAQQLAKAQTGTKLQKVEDQTIKSKKKKSPKQPTTVSQPSGFSTETSSTAGRDADDDLTPAESPAVKPVDKPSTAGDISDMLEAPAAKPTTLRLTGISDENKPKKKQAAQPFEQVLSKKQRQAQAKKDELRQMKEESDRLHEAKKQEQLRRARTAAGTSNQTKADNFARTANAWQSNKGTAAVKAPPSDTVAPLLDTFEPQANNISHPNGAVHAESLSTFSADSAASLKHDLGEGRASAVTASHREAPPVAAGSWAGQITEEDQMKLLEEQQAEDAWESVTSKKSKKKVRPDNDSGSDAPAPAPTPVIGHSSAAAVSRAPTSAAGTSNIPERGQAGTTNRFNSIQISNGSGLEDAEWEA